MWNLRCRESDYVNVVSVTEQAIEHVKVPARCAHDDDSPAHVRPPFQLQLMLSRAATGADTRFYLANFAA
jgi:hypothetical protein